MGFSNTEALAVVKWMVRTRLLETMYEPEARKAFDRKIRDDFAELIEAGLVAHADVTHDEEGTVSVKLHRNGDRFVFRATVADGRIEIERRALCL
jgi:plasmid stabilization system protein ParE